jgi:hypothetical protein
MDDEQISRLLEILAGHQLHEFETNQAALELHDSLCEYEQKRIDFIRAEIRALKQEARRLKDAVRPPRELITKMEISRAASFAAQVFASVMSGQKTVFQPLMASESHRTLHYILNGQMGLYTQGVEAVLKSTVGPSVIASVLSRTRHVRGGGLLVTAEDDEVIVKTSNEEDNFAIEAECFFGVSGEIEEGVRLGDFYLFN